MKKKHLIAIIAALALLFTVTATGCNSISSVEHSIASSTSDAQQLFYTQDDIQALFPEGLDIAILQGTQELDLISLIQHDPAVKNITLESSILDFNIAGQVTVTYTITVDAAALAEKLGVDPEDGETEITTMETGRVYIVTPAEASEFLARHPDLTIYTTGGAPYTPETETVPADQEAHSQTDPAIGTETGQVTDSGSPDAGTSDTTQPSTENTGSSGGGNTSSKPGTGNSGGSSGGGSTTQQPTHTHSWEPVYGTVHHDEVGHYETQTVSEAWDEPVYEGRCVCSACGYTTSAGGDAAVDDISIHILTQHGGVASYSVKSVQTGTIHHDAVTQQVWVVDQAAYDEQVITGYRCSCGATK